MATKKNKPTLTRSEKLRAWLKGRDLFNYAALCRRIDYNRGAFSHWLEGHNNWDLSDQAMDRLESALIAYGYKP